jgi:hypothetical protein
MKCWRVRVEGYPDAFVFADSRPMAQARVAHTLRDVFNWPWRRCFVRPRLMRQPDEDHRATRARPGVCYTLEMLP